MPCHAPGVRQDHQPGGAAWHEVCPQRRCVHVLREISPVSDAAYCNTITHQEKIIIPIFPTPKADKIKMLYFVDINIVCVVGMPVMEDRTD